MSPTKIKVSRSEKALGIMNIVIVTIFTLACFYPFFYVLISSLSDPKAVSQGVFLWPVRPTLTTYKQIFAKGDVPNAFLVSTARTVVGTLLCVLASSFFAYLVTKKEMLFRRFFYRLVIITMYFSAGLIPWYITMKMFGLKNSFLLYVLPGAVNAFYIILVKTFLEQLPPSLEESAALDGAGIFTIYRRIILPLSKPILATIAVYCAVAQWNSWTDNFFLVTNPKLQTLQLILYNYLSQAQVLANSMKNSLGMAGTIKLDSITPQSIQLAITIVSVIPIMVVYPFLQKQFAKGIMMGAIKG